MLLRFFAPIVANIVGLYIAIHYIPGVDFTGPRWMLIVAAVVLSLLNFFVRPVLKILALPIIFLTAGLFSVVINLGMLWLADTLIPELTIEGIAPLMFTTILLSIVHFVI